MNTELWKEVNETLRDYENKTGVQIKCDWRLDPKVKKIVNEGPVTKAEIKQTIPASPLGSEQPILMEDPSSLEIFEAIQGPVNKNHSWFIEDPEVNLEFLNEAFTKELESRKPFFVGTFTDDDGKEQGQPNEEVVPFAFEFFKKDERFTNAEKFTNNDSGLLALCAISAETPEKQAILYKKYLNLILNIHEENPQLLSDWLKIQQEPEPYRSYTTFFKNDHVTLDSGVTSGLKPVEERLVVLDDFEGTWKKRIEELVEALSKNQFEPYHLRWIEFLSHSTDIVKIHALFINAENINIQYRKAVEDTEKNAAEARKREEIKTEEPIRPIRVVESEKVSERIHRRVINRTPGGLRTLALVGLVGAAALWLAFCRPQPQSETILIPGTNITIDTTSYKYENPDKYLATFPGIMNENLSSVTGRCEGNWAISNNLRPANFDRDNANTPYRQKVAQMSLSERNSHQILIQKCVEFIGHVNPRGAFEFNIQPIGLLAKHKDNGVTNTFIEPRDYRDFFSKVA